MSAVSFRCHLPAALGYHVLAHVDLGADAANLYQSHLPPRPWAAALARAMCDAPSALALQFVPLMAPDLAALRACDLSAFHPAQLGAPDLALRAAFERAVCEEGPGFQARWRGDGPLGSSDGGGQQIMQTLARVGPALEALRRALYEAQPSGPPPLEVLHCPPLTVHGRGMPAPGLHRVAVDLGQGAAHVLCQILHEEIHAVTDPVVGAAGRQTQAGAAGAAVHVQLEIAAVEVGQALIEARAPEWGPAYAAWRARVGAAHLGR